MSDTLDGPLGVEFLGDLGASLGTWELEIGFGKGRYLLRRAQEDPDQRLLGIEMVSQYFRMAASRAHRRGLSGVTFLQGEALFLLATWLPPGFARTIHIYFPDPWPKAKHHRRRLFDEETVDLLLRALAPGGAIAFATDHQLYGARVLEVLEGHPALEVEQVQGVWADGARTNYEAKFITEGRAISRLMVRKKPLGDSESLLHPHGRESLLVGPVADSSKRPSVGSATVSS